MTEPGPWSPPPPVPPTPPPAGGWWGPPSGPPAGGWSGGPPNPPNPPKPPREGAPWAIVALMAIVAAVLGGAIGGLVVRKHSSNTPSVGNVTIGATGGGRTVVDRPPNSVAGVAAKIVPSVVSIEVKVGNGGDTGSGIVLDKSGYIMTNNHVIAAAKTSGSVLSVVLPDQTKVPATIIGHPDTVDDIAIIKVSGVNGLKPAVIGNSNDLAVGDPVIAVGSPLGLASTVTSGIVSALNRPVEAGDSTASGPQDVIDAIQTDAAINPGNSGGALVNSAGAVVGVNSAIASLSSDTLGSSQSGSIGLGFAIPINEADRIAKQIIQMGYSTHAIIGVSLDGSYKGSGARIGSPTSGQPAVTAGGPAAKAGLKEGDIIVGADGEKITTPDELIVAIRRHPPGDSFTLTYLRGGVRNTVTLTLGSMRSN